MLAILAQSLALTLLITVAIGVGAWFAIDAAAAPYVSGANGAGLATLLAIVLGVATLWLGFRAIAIAVVGLFGDQVVQAVERRHYPAALTHARPVPFHRSLWMGVGSVARLLGYNLLASPVYVVTFATGIGLPIAFFAVNGWLLARDLGDMVAVRHLPRADLPGWRRATRWQRLGIGLLTGGLFTVPVVNFVAPMVGAAAMTHLFHRRRR